jgi:protein regulator of cytokinesis 1
MKKVEELTDLLEELKFLHGELCLPLEQVEINRTTWIIPDSMPLEVSYNFLPIVTAFIIQEDAKSLVNVDPTEGLLTFCATLQAAWLGEKSQREAKIQTLFDEVEPIWLRLQVSQEEIQTFIEEHCGLSTATIAAYEVELERVKILRRESLGGFIQAIRQEIQGLWDRLLYGPRTMEGFAAFYEGKLGDAIESWMSRD